MSWPAYLEIADDLERRAREAVAGLARCAVCPRDCGVDRLEDERRVCETGRKARVSSHFPHHGEEDCLRGWRGSGTIFFSWCNLKCVFCQNWEISSEGEGRDVDAERLARMMLDLQARGCHNLNLVTPEHVVPQVLEALPIAVAGGLRIPLVYNTSAYDSLESLRLLDGVVDIYMPDFKLWRPEASARLLAAKDYPERARAAIAEMHRQVGDLSLEPDTGLARRGMLVRHLVMPGCLEDTAAILHWLATEIGPDTYVNLMDQYHPAGRVAREPDGYSEISRPLGTREFAEAVALALRAGLSRLAERRGILRRPPG